MKKRYRTIYESVALDSRGRNMFIVQILESVGERRQAIHVRMRWRSQNGLLPEMQLLLKCRKQEEAESLAKRSWPPSHLKEKATLPEPSRLATLRDWTRRTDMNQQRKSTPLHSESAFEDRLKGSPSAVSSSLARDFAQKFGDLYIVDSNEGPGSHYVHERPASSFAPESSLSNGICSLQSAPRGDRRYRRGGDSSVRLAARDDAYRAMKTAKDQSSSPRSRERRKKDPA